MRLFYLQILQGNKYREFAENNRQRIIPIQSKRGIIYDRNGIELSKNIPNFSIALTPQDLPREKEKREDIINKLSDITQKKPEEISSILDKYGSYSYESIIIQEDIDYETALKILIESSGLQGIQIQKGSKRLYQSNTKDNPDKQNTTSTPESISHILGYTGKLDETELDNLYSLGYLPSDNIGKIGIEKQYETELRGKYGQKRIEVNSLGKEQNVLSENLPEPGKNIFLTIDIDMQNKS